MVEAIIGQYCAVGKQRLTAAVPSYLPRFLPSSVSEIRESCCECKQVLTNAALCLLKHVRSRNINETQQRLRL